MLLDGVDTEGRSGSLREGVRMDGDGDVWLMREAFRCLQRGQGDGTDGGADVGGLENVGIVVGSGE